MSSEFALDVADVVIALRDKYDHHIIPSDSLIARARSLLNSSGRLVEKPSEQVESDLDYLQGLFTWARLVSAPAYLDPRVLGWERTRRRLKAKRKAEELERMPEVLGDAATAAPVPPPNTPPMQDSTRRRKPHPGR